MGAVSNLAKVEKIVSDQLDMQAMGEEYGYAVGFDVLRPQPGVQIIQWRFSFTLANALVGKPPHGYIGTIAGDLPGRDAIAPMVGEAIKVMLATRAATMTGTMQKNGHGSLLHRPGQTG